MSNPTVVLDSGVIDRATGNQEFRWVLRDLLEDGWEPVIPTVTLSEAITGHPQDAPVDQLISRIGTVDTEQATARRAGQLRFRVDDPVRVECRPVSTPSSPPMPLMPMRRWCSLPILLTSAASLLSAHG